MKTLTASDGSVILIDDEDYDWACNYSWSTTKRRTVTYARAYLFGGRSSRRVGYLHRLVMNAPPEVEVDHRNGNGLDCRRSNLRLATTIQNRQNQGKTRGVRYKYKGVRYRARTGSWEAYIGQGGKYNHLGTFPTEELAATAYNEAAKERFGAFARLNTVTA